MGRSSKDLAKRLRFDRYPLPDLFRRVYWLAAAAAVVIAAGVWALLSGALGERQYLPGPVSSTHATFGDRCAACHISYRSVRDAACAECHGERRHTQFDTQPACRHCHVEHRHADVFLSVSAQACVGCHARLASSREKPAIVPAIDSFATHPVFTARREGQRDAAALRFNHKAHLTSDKILPDQKLQCASCHQVEPDGALMAPIVFETHCQRCHELKVKEMPAPIGEIEAPHEPPDAVRPALAAQLLVIAVANPQPLFVGMESTLPGVRARPPLDASRDLGTYQSTWLAKLEERLYQPFQDRAPLLESNTYCFLCHLEKGERAAGALPEVVPPKIPHRWLARGGFSHRRHEVLECRICHAAVARSEATADVNLPKNEVCTRCHADDRPQSAGTRCMLCHVYHDTSRDPALRAARHKVVPLDRLLAEP
jgi:hypothetical protein